MSDFIRQRERYPMSYDKKDRFYRFDTNPRAYRGDGVSFKQGGYNPSHQTTRVEKINLLADEIVLKKR